MDVLFRLLKEYIRPYWPIMAAAVILSALSSSNVFVIGYLTKIAVDEVLQIRPAQNAGAGLPTGGPWLRGEAPRSPEVSTFRHEMPSAQPAPRKRPEREKISLLILLFFAFLVSRSLLTGFQWIYSYQVNFVGLRIIFHMRRQLHEKLQQLQLTYFDRNQTGKLMSRVLDDVGVIQQNGTEVFVSLITNGFRLLVGCVILLSLDVKLALIAFLTLPFYAVSYQMLRRRIREVSRAIRRQIAEIYGLLEERVAAVRVVFSFARERSEALILHRKLSKLLRQRIRNAMQNTSLSALSVLISAMGTAFVLYVGAYQVRSGVLTLGGLLFFNQALLNMFEPIALLTNMNIRIQWITVVISRIFEVLDEEVRIKDAPGAIRLGRIQGRVSLDEVSMRYDGTIRDALSRVSFDVRHGTSVSIVGPSGSGKSTLVSLLLRLYDPTEGRILIDGHDLRGIRLSSLRHHIGMVPQEPILFSGTIAENIAYGRYDASAQEIMNAARAAELHDFVMSLPDKYESEVGERGVNLSGGQKQRLAFAMALLTNPEILILDDSTSALDAETEARIQSTLDRIMKGRTTIIITHRISTAMRADMIVVLDSGRVADTGTHEELISREGIYWKLYEQQRRGVIAEEEIVAGDEEEAARLEGLKEEMHAEALAVPGRFEMSPASPN